MTLSHRIKQQLALVCAMPPERIKDDAWLIEYGFDSLRSMELVVALEEHFDVQIGDETIERLRTVCDVIALIEAELTLKRACHDAPLPVAA